MDLDLDLARQQSDENPVYYVQYGHARIASILRYAEEQGYTDEGADVSLLTHPSELALIRKMLELPEVVALAAENLAPHHLPYYAQDLASTLPRFLPRLPGGQLGAGRRRTDQGPPAAGQGSQTRAGAHAHADRSGRAREDVAIGIISRMLEGLKGVASSRQALCCGSDKAQEVSHLPIQQNKGVESVSNNRSPVIVSAARTAIGSFGGTLATIPAPELGAAAIRAAVERAGIDPGSIDEVLMGSVVTAGLGQAPARQAAIKAGIPAHVGAVTLNKVCGSGLKTAMLAAGLVKAGDGDIYVAGGMENMNRRLTCCSRGAQVTAWAMVKCWMPACTMGCGALLRISTWDWLPSGSPRKYGVSREEQDRFALESHRKAVAAQDAGRFTEEIVPVEVPQRKGEPLVFDVDENPRQDTSLEKLARLRPVFKVDGTVTAGNASAITDGAAAVVVMSQAKAEELGIQPLARITGYCYGAVEPIEIFTAPVLALRNLMQKTGTKLDDYDLFELNEAFAAQCLGDGKTSGR